MFKNSKGKLVPHCEDCRKVVGDDSGMTPIEDTCPKDALDIVDSERGVLDCPGYAPIRSEGKGRGS